MKTEHLPTRWRAAAPALRAVQIAFDVSEHVLNAVRTCAFHAGRSNSDQVRVVLGLPVLRQSKRPRLTVSLSGEDYHLLGQRYQLDPTDHLRIKERVAQELGQFARDWHAGDAQPPTPSHPQRLERP